MARFHEMTVTDVQKTIRNAVVVTLQPPKAQENEFEFVQGQYLTFRKTFEGQEIRRSYSICSGQSDGILQIGIKQVEGGAFSTWANTNLKPGDTLEAMVPMGSFYAGGLESPAKNSLAFAGGSGITPILSIIKTALSNEPRSRFTLVYANQGAHTIMFREELEDLKNIFMDRLAVVHILESEGQDSDLFTGRIDAAKCADLFRHWIDINCVDVAYICGPEPMMLAIRQALQDQGLGKDQVRYELFAGTQVGQAPRRIASETGAETAMSELTVTIDGTAHNFNTGPDTSVLDATLAQSIDVPFACKAGVCSSCRCKVLEGDVEMVANHSLEDYEVEQGYILACQSYVSGNKIRVDFDQ